MGSDTGKESKRLHLLNLAPRLAAAVIAVLMLGVAHSNRGALPLNSDLGCSPAGPAIRVQVLDGPQSSSFLVAARSLRDPNFAQTVVLLIDYDPEGAFGLIIDRPTLHTMAELWPEIAGLDVHSVFFGGPVFPNRLLFLLRSNDAPPGMRQVIKGVHLGSDELILKRIIARGEEVFRVYAGYSGWAPGQLDNEIARGDWHILPAERRFIFDPGPSKVWEELIQRVDIQVVNLQQ